MSRAPAYATIQDAGRRHHLSQGVPRSGAMDLHALYALNAMLGNGIGAAAIEIALSACELTFEESHTFAIGGAEAELALDGREVSHWQAHRAERGQTLSIGAPSRGRFVYVAPAGGIDCPVVMGSRSTWLPGELGGLEGRRLRTGDILTVGAVSPRRRHQVSDPLADGLRPPLMKDEVRFIPRTETTVGREWAISAASDRTGYRLASEKPEEGGSVISEPVCPGVIQLPPGGEPIVLMADAPTIGGYRIAGAVIGADIGALAQCMPGASVRLVATTIDVAQRELAMRSGVLDRVREWSLL